MADDISREILYILLNRFLKRETMRLQEVVMKKTVVLGLWAGLPKKDWKFGAKQNKILFSGTK